MADTVYPKWKYHESFEAVIVKSADEEVQLGATWKDSPADCGKPESAPAFDSLKLKPKAKK